MSEGQAPQRYLAGERISIGIELQDDSGIYDVTGFFVNSENPNAVITLPGYGGGAQHTTVHLQNVVVTNTPPGEYVCEYVQAQDGKGNYSTLHPDITFYVDQQPAPVDDQGPELEGWDFSEEIQVVEMSVIEAERRPELTAKSTSEDTSTQGDIEEATPEAPTSPDDAQEGDALQLIEGKMDEMATEITEDTGGHGDVRLHTERRMDQMAKEMTEDTGGHGDIREHAQRRTEEMAKDMFED